MPPEASGPRSMGDRRVRIKESGKGSSPEITKFSRKVFHIQTLPDYETSASDPSSADTNSKTISVTVFE